MDAVSSTDATLQSTRLRMGKSGQSIQKNGDGRTSPVHVDFLYDLNEFGSVSPTGMLPIEDLRFEIMESSMDSSFNTSSDFDSSSPELSLRGSRKRKSFFPRRSSRLDDPNFRGATIWMENVYKDNEWKLCIKSKLSLSPKRKRKYQSGLDSSDEDDSMNSCENDSEKQCASCSTVKTPLWRDAEDGTPLCNACGIRYKKYKLRCTGCWYIPKKDEFSPRCSCGAFYEYVATSRR